MKANAPERIWIDNLDEGFWFDSPSGNKSIEYIRKDAFMKKEENFLEMLGYGFTIIDNITHKNYDKEQLIEDFKNYMEGE